MAEQQTYPGQVNACSYTCSQPGITREGKSASLNNSNCWLSLTLTCPQASGMWWPQQQQTALPGTLSWPPLLPTETANFSKGRSLLPSEQGCCCCSWGRGQLVRAIPQLTRSCWTGASLNDPVMADTGVCRSNSRHSYRQGWLCFCKGCAQAVTGWKANKHFPEKAWWMKWTEH